MMPVHLYVEEEVAESVMPSLPTLTTLDDKSVSHEENVSDEENEPLEVEDNEEATELSDSVEALADRETIAYVVEAHIRRLGCRDCDVNLFDRNAPMASSFTAIMTYDSASMLNPKFNVVSAFCDRLTPILNYYEKHFYTKNIVKSACIKFRLTDDFPACSQLHANALLTFFARMLLRNFCKSKNSKLKSRAKNKKKFSKMNV